MSQQKWSLRPLNDGDVSFVFSSFLKSCREAPAFQEIPNHIYFAKMHERMEATLDGPQTFTIVACDPSEPDVVFGYIVGELVRDDLVIHYTYVKHALRGFGLGKAMEGELLKIPHQKVYYSMRTRVSDSLNRSRRYIYDPFLLWGK